MGSVRCCSGSWCSSSVSSTTPGWIWLMLQQARPHTTGTIASIYDTHITSLSKICCFWNENTLHAFPSHGLVIITKHLSTRRPSFPESLDLITPGNTPLFPQTLKNVGFWALLLQSQTLLWLVECKGGKKMQPNLKRQTLFIEMPWLHSTSLIITTKCHSYSISTPSFINLSWALWGPAKRYHFPQLAGKESDVSWQIRTRSQGHQLLTPFLKGVKKKLSALFLYQDIRSSGGMKKPLPNVLHTEQHFLIPPLWHRASWDVDVQSLAC